MIHTGWSNTNLFYNQQKGLKLINFDLDEKNPNDCSYVYSGLAPLM